MQLNSTYKASKIASKFSPAYWDLKEEKLKVNTSFFKNLINLILRNTALLKKECKKNLRLIICQLFLTQIQLINNIIW